MDWHLSSSAAWITAAPSSGIIYPSSTGSVNVYTNAAANTLPVGTYSASLQFVNDTNPAVITRVITLTVTPFTILEVVPITPESFTGHVGGPFG
jgi:hypothetical protein